MQRQLAAHLRRGQAGAPAAVLPWLFQQGQDAVGGAAKQLVLGADHLQGIGHHGHRFAGSQKQGAAAIERIQQGMQHALLCGRLEIDQRVAADHQVHLGERRVRQQILAGKHDALTHFGLDE